MNPEIAKWIVDRYNAWRKISLDDEVVAQEDEDMKKQEEEEAVQRIQKLIQVGISTLADGQKIEGKVGEDRLLFCFCCCIYTRRLSRAHHACTTSAPRKEWSHINAAVYYFSDSILRAISVPDEVFKNIMKKSKLG